VSEPGVDDATHRTRLASERTYLAWWRTGLTTFAVAVGVGRLTPALTHHHRWPYVALGAAFGVVGVGFVLLAHLRTRAVEAALRRGEFAVFSDRLSLALTAAGAALGVATVLLVLFVR
jgi:inner membrane protein YidH